MKIRKKVYFNLMWIFCRWRQLVGLLERLFSLFLFGTMAHILNPYGSILHPTTLLIENTLKYLLLIIPIKLKINLRNMNLNNLKRLLKGENCLPST